MIRKSLFLSFVALFFSSLSIFAQQDEPEAPVARLNIFESITDNSDNTKGTIIINQDDRIKELVLRKRDNTLKTKTYATEPGFRVQIFSSNEQRTAKVQAYKIEEKVKEKFPELPVYVSYISPFWKVRVGDCVTNFEAQSLRNDLKSQFPEFQQETYIVKEQILVPE